MNLPVNAAFISPAHFVTLKGCSKAESPVLFQVKCICIGQYQIQCLIGVYEPHLQWLDLRMEKTA